MIDLIFQKGTQVINIRISEKKITFAEVKGQLLYFSPIEKLNWNIACILEKWPELRDKKNDEIKEIAIQRFKEHIGSLTTETEIAIYLEDDLKPHGYILKGVNIKGHRTKKTIQ
jgi:hypothetical protein